MTLKIRKNPDVVVNIEYIAASLSRENTKKAIKKIPGIKPLAPSDILVAFRKPTQKMTVISQAIGGIGQQHI
jgi:hypothetical protein